MNIRRLSKRYFFDFGNFKIVDLADKRPNLFILGSQKCGTTSLHNYLNEHPSIFMSSPLKESGYFIYEQWMKPYWKSKKLKVKNKTDLLLKYMLKGYNGEFYFGDSSTYYTIDQREKDFDIPRLIKDEVNEPKFLYLIRNPFERIISLYHHLIKYEGYNNTLSNVVKSSKSALNTSLYFTRLSHFLNFFPKDSFHIIQFENLILNPQNEVSKIYNFLDIDDFKHKSFGQFNKTTPSEVKKFSQEDYNYLIIHFEKEKKMLEEFFKINLNWDFTDKSWVNNSID